MKIYGADASEKEIKSQKTMGAFKTVDDLESRVALIEGRMPQEREDGVYEAVVTNSFPLKAKRGLGEELIAESANEGTFRVVPVGIVETKPDADPYLPYATSDDSDGFLIPFAIFEREFTNGGKARVAELEWRYALDYERMKLERADVFLTADRDIRRYFKGKLGVAEVNIPASATVLGFQGLQSKLDVMLVSLYTPVMLMLAFYLYMAANLIIDRQKTDISVLRSRGRADCRS